MPTIALIRHGETEWNRRQRIQGSSDIPLNDTGREQAAQAAEAVRQLDATTVMSSPLVRAEETASIIASLIGIPFGGTDAGLVERHYGRAEGMNVAEAHMRWPDFQYPDAEPLDALRARGRDAIERLTASHDVAVAVAHGTFIRVTVTAMTGETLPRLGNGDVVLLNRDPSGWQWSFAAAVGAVQR